MNRRIAFLLMLLPPLVFALFAGCGDDEECTTCLENQGPKLSLQPRSLDLGASIPTHRFDVVNLGTGTLEWSLSTSAPWLSASPDTGSTTTEVDPVTVSVDRTAVDNGAYSAAVVVSSNAGTDSVTVTMEVPGHLFEIAVRTPEGAPVEGLRVSLWNLLPCWVSAEGAPCTSDLILDGGVSAFEEARQATTFWIDLEADARVDLEIFDLDGRLVEVLIDDEEFFGGSNSQLWFGPESDVGTAVYEARLTVRSLDGEQRDQESVYAVLARADVERSVVGFTDADGAFFTNDETLFPGLAEVVGLQAMDEVCVPQGSFALEPVVFVYLQSSDGSSYDDYELTLTGSENEFTLVWEPQPVGAGLHGSRELLERSPGALRTHLSTAAVPDSLRGPCPNPFH